MKLPDDQERLKGLLQETITLLCKNGLNYKAEFSVEALIVVTLDQEQMFHANIKETVAKEGSNISLELEDHSRSASKRNSKKRRCGEDGLEVPKKRNSQQNRRAEDSHEVYDESVKFDEETSSESVVIKDEQKMKSPPVPLRDLEYVDQSGEHFSQQPQGVWSAASPYSADDASRAQSQEDEVDKATPRHSAVRSSENRSHLQEEGEVLKIDTRGSSVVKRSEKWFKSKDAPPAKSVTSQILVTPTAAGQEKDPMETIGMESAGEYFMMQPELVSVVPSGSRGSEKKNLEGLIKQEVDKVRQEIEGAPTISVEKAKIEPIISGTPTPRRKRGQRAQSPEIKVPRGRPVNPAVTSMPLTEEEALDSPVPLVTMETPSVVRVTTRRQPIKVLSLKEEAMEKPKPRVCINCGLSFTSEQSLADHQCGEKNLFRCGICDAMFMRKENLKKHFGLHRDDVAVEVLEHE